jgi:hypothetical protein
MVVLRPLIMVFILVFLAATSSAFADNFPAPVKWSASKGYTMGPVGGPAGPPLLVPPPKTTAYGPGPGAPMPLPVPVCAPPDAVGFNPLRAVAAIVTLPFRLVGGAVSALKSHRAPHFAAPGCFPMEQPPFLPLPPTRMAKCKPGQCPPMNPMNPYPY